MRLGNRYELKAPLAAGGMAQVWSATDLDLDREVAAKILHPHLATDSAFVERFRREAVAAAGLSHESIVSIYDTVSSGSTEAIVMELIDGRTLRAMIDEAGALPAADVIHYGVRIASALDAAHRAGIVHRDIKPANIMVCPDRRVLVTDFGIAKAGTDADLTTTGTLLGTAKYLSPEQVSGEPIDPRSDLYSLGVVLFEALTGTVPFRANTDAATALARLHQNPPRVRELRANVPGPLEAIVDRLMARDVRDRFPRAIDVAEALARVDPSAPPGPVSDPVALDGPGTARLRPPEPPPGTHTGPPTGNPAPYSAPGANRGEPPAVGAAAYVPRADVTPPADTGSTASRPPDPPPTATQGPPLADPSLELLGVERPLGAAPDPVGAERVKRSRRSRVLGLGLVVLVVAGLVGAVGAFGGLGDDAVVNPFDESSPGLAIAGVTSFDPQTTDDPKEENEEQTPLAIDGDIETAWRTEIYRRRQLGGLKDGVGLLLTIEKPLPLNQIELVTNTTGWEADIYVGTEFSDVDLASWGQPAAVVQAGSNRVVRDLGRVEGDVILIWITDTGESDGRFRFELAEVIIR